MIFDLFAYSKPYEIDLLLAKLNIEKSIDGFIIVENNYDLRGKPKGDYTLKNIVESGVRFEPFRDKIHIIEVSQTYPIKDGIDDFRVIEYQRNVEYQKLLELASEDDYMIISDLDEMIDFDKGIEFNPEVVNCPVCFTYCYDYNNYSGLWYHLKVVTLKLWKQISATTHFKNLQWLRYYEPYYKIEGRAYHYNNCLPAICIWDKLNTYGHTNWLEKHLISMLRYNHGYCDNNREYSDKVGRLYTVELTDKNSNEYIRNLPLLNNVDKNYIENRKKDFPQYF